MTSLVSERQDVGPICCPVHSGQRRWLVALFGTQRHVSNLQLAGDEEGTHRRGLGTSFHQQLGKPSEEPIATRAQMGWLGWGATCR